MTVTPNTCCILDLRLQCANCRYALPEEDVVCQVKHALTLVGMETYQDRPTHTLSGGQKQRVAIAGALAECPKVLPQPSVSQPYSFPCCGNHVQLSSRTAFLMRVLRLVAKESFHNHSCLGTISRQCNGMKLDTMFCSNMMRVMQTLSSSSVCTVE